MCSVENEYIMIINTLHFFSVLSCSLHGSQWGGMVSSFLEQCFCNLCEIQTEKHSQSSSGAFFLQIGCPMLSCHLKIPTEILTCPVVDLGYGAVAGWSDQECGAQVTWLSSCYKKPHTAGSLLSSWEARERSCHTSSSEAVIFGLSACCLWEIIASWFESYPAHLFLCLTPLIG